MDEDIEDIDAEVIELPQSPKADDDYTIDLVADDNKLHFKPDEKGLPMLWNVNSLCKNAFELSYIYIAHRSVIHK